MARPPPAPTSTPSSEAHGRASRGEGHPPVPARVSPVPTPDTLPPAAAPRRSSSESRPARRQGPRASSSRAGHCLGATWHCPRCPQASAAGGRAFAAASPRRPLSPALIRPRGRSSGRSSLRNWRPSGGTRRPCSGWRRRDAEGWRRRGGRQVELLRLPSGATAVGADSVRPSRPCGSLRLPIGTRTRPRLVCACGWRA